MNKKQQTVEVICPKCKNTEIIFVPEEDMPKCEQCGARMIIREILREGKAT